MLSWLVLVFLFVGRLVDSHAPDEKASDCSSWPPPCSQLCTVKDEGHELECSCRAGYTLFEDHRHCGADVWLDGPYLVYSQEKHLAMKSMLDPLSPLHELPRKHVADVRIGAFAVDISSLNIYYTSTRPGFSGTNRDLNIIKVTDFRGMNDTEVVTRGLIRITSVALDWIGRVLYIGDRGLHQILACSLDTHHCSSVKSVGDPASVAVNPFQRKLYWSDCSSSHSHLYESNMDGSEAEVLIQLSSDGCIEQLQVDLLHDTLYWINRGVNTHHINSFRLDTRQITEMSRMSSAMALFSDDIFWTHTSMNDQYQTKMTDVFAEDKFEMEVPVEDASYMRFGLEKVQHGIVSLPAHIAIVHKVQQPEAPNPCENSHCSHVCLLKSGEKTSCACPAGFSLSEDGSSCKANWTTPSVVVVKEKRLVRVVPDLIGSNDLDIMFEAQDEITALTFDWSSRTLYYSTNGSKESGDSSQISRLLLDQMHIKEKVVFKEDSSIIDMEADWMSNNLYWISYESRDIMVGRLDGSAKVSLLHNINKSGIVEYPTALALHPTERKLYYSDCGTHPHIGICDMAGEDCVTRLIDVNGGCASDMFLEVSTGWVYWTDSKRHKIMKSDPAQSSTDMFRMASVPIAVVSGGDRMFWTGAYISGIRYATEQVNRDTTIHFGVDGFKRMIYFADFVQQPQEKNECATNNGGCSVGVCVITRTGHRCLTSEEELTAEVHALLTSPGYLSSEEKFEGSHTTSGPSPVTVHKTLKIKSNNPRKQCNCLNGGECDIQAGFICRCSDEYYGASCELTKLDSPNSHSADPLSPQDSQTIMYAAIGVIAIAVLLAIIIAVICLQKRCRSTRRQLEDDETKTLGTPLYENPSGGKNIHTLSIPRPKVAQENDYC